ncbi:WXG100-like domain-containing protein, partial [Amycolatopsis alkalitolerans]
MGIELPPELADVAAATGLSWPQADEDKLRAQADAWRGAQSKLHSLAADADHTAGGAIGALSGPSADAARTMWSDFVHPDKGKLTLAAQGAGAAADRLTHAADQVGSAKVEMIRQLTDAAKNQDAAHAAASAGHPSALLGVDTVLHGTAANLSSLTHGLAGAIGPGGGGRPELVDPNPGVHSPHGQGGLLSAVTGVPAHLLAPAGDDPSFEDSPLLRPVHDVTAGAVGTAGSAVAGVAPPDAAPGLTGASPPPAVDDPGGITPPAGVPGPVGAASGAVADTGPPPGLNADAGTGPIQTGHYDGFLAHGGFDNVPTPPSGHHLPGGTVASGFAGGTYQPPPTVQPSYAPPVVHQPLPPPPAAPAPAQLPPPVPGGVAPVAPPAPARPVPPVVPVPPARPVGPPVAGPVA